MSVYMTMSSCLVFTSGSNESIYVYVRQLFLLVSQIRWNNCDVVGLSTYYFGSEDRLDHIEVEVLAVFTEHSTYYLVSEDPLDHLQEGVLVVFNSTQFDNHSL